MKENPGDQDKNQSDLENILVDAFSLKHYGGHFSIRLSFSFPMGREGRTTNRTVQGDKITGFRCRLMGLSITVEHNGRTVYSYIFNKPYDGEILTPKVYDDELIGFDQSKLNVRALGCNNSASGILRMWIDLERQGLPLNEIFTIFIKCTQLMPQVNMPPHWAYLVRLVDLILSCEETIKGHKNCEDLIGDIGHKIVWLKRTLGRILRHDRNTTDPTLVLSCTGRILSKILSTISEFTILLNLMWMKDVRSIRLLQNGPDFEIDGIRCEVKKTEHELLGRFITHDPESLEDTKIDYLTLSTTLCSAVLPMFERGFDEQKAQILFIDISWTLPGLLLTIPWTSDSEENLFDHAFWEAIKLVKKGKQSVIIYAEAGGDSHVIRAITLEREALENVGRNLDMVKAKLKEQMDKKITSIELANYLRSQINNVHGLCDNPEKTTL